jgi:hypothetical protein
MPVVLFTNWLDRMVGLVFKTSRPISRSVKVQFSIRVLSVEEFNNTIPVRFSLASLNKILCSPVPTAIKVAGRFESLPPIISLASRHSIGFPNRTSTPGSMVSVTIASPGFAGRTCTVLQSLIMYGLPDNVHVVSLVISSATHVCASADLTEPIAKNTIIINSANLIEKKA